MLFKSCLLILLVYMIPRILTLFPKPENITSTTEKALVDINSLNYSVYCKFQSYTYKCGVRQPIPSYYYDIKMQDCLRTQYGHCQNAYNNFKTKRECKKKCMDAGLHFVPVNLTTNIVCHFQPDFGNCQDYHQRYYFDINESKCKGFGYSGCDGNHNRFLNVKTCQIECEEMVNHTEE